MLLLALALWLGVDAVIRGEGRTPWLALAGLLLAVPLVVAFTLRPAVYANAVRLRVRNPFRTITLPWATVESLRAAYSSEVFADGHKYQLWSIPVSLRARKKAARGAGRPSRREVSDPHIRVPAAPAGPSRAPSDQALADLRELQELNEKRPEAQGPVVVRWAFEVIAPCVAGAVLLAVLLAIG
ncbi:PH domain-containing protein [Streptomyces sp. T-3]|nr:PH domain-containing protein [Streptomyces sp. T-3]